MHTRCFLSLTYIKGHTCLYQCAEHVLHVFTRVIEVTRECPEHPNTPRLMLVTHEPEVKAYLLLFPVVVDLYYTEVYLEI